MRLIYSYENKLITLVGTRLKGYLCYKMITFQNVSSEAQVKNLVEKLCSVLKIFKVLYF